MEKGGTNKEKEKNEFVVLHDWQEYQYEFEVIDR